MITTLCPTAVADPGGFCWDRPVRLRRSSTGGYFMVFRDEFEDTQFDPVWQVTPYGNPLRRTWCSRSDNVRRCVDCPPRPAELIMQVDWVRVWQ
jgi:hypothetical protein